MRRVGMERMHSIRAIFVAVIVVCGLFSTRTECAVLSREEEQERVQLELLASRLEECQLAINGFLSYYQSTSLDIISTLQTAARSGYEGIDPSEMASAAKTLIAHFKLSSDVFLKTERFIHCLISIQEKDLELLESGDFSRLTLVGPREQFGSPFWKRFIGMFLSALGMALNIRDLAAEKGAYVPALPFETSFGDELNSLYVEIGKQETNVVSLLEKHRSNVAKFATFKPLLDDKSLIYLEDMSLVQKMSEDVKRRLHL